MRSRRFSSVSKWVSTISVRIAAQTAKQVIIQKIRDAEREMTFNEFKDPQGRTHYRYRSSVRKRQHHRRLGTRGSHPSKREQVQTETYRQGDRIQAYVLDITRASRSPQVVLSRTHPGLLMKLFELEVPEIYEGIVRIEACAREPGHRAKIAVSSMDRDVDPVGACVGLKGSRVQAVVQSYAVKPSTSFRSILTQHDSSSMQSHRRMSLGFHR